MKGILLAGGVGSRLYPLTKVVSKQLMPVYDKPMVYYPLSVLMLAGIRDILVISTPYDLPLFERLLGSGEQWGVQFSYAEQPNPGGLAQALVIGDSFLKGEPVCFILGDNIFYGSGLSAQLKKMAELTRGAHIFGYYFQNPRAYGVIEFDQKGQAISLEEKPQNPKSHYAVPGIYFYDGNASAYSKEQKPSQRGELEITDLNLRYLKENLLQVSIMSRGTAWLDTGTHTSLMQASNFIQTIVQRQGLQVGCPEEIAYKQGFITIEDLLKSAKSLEKTDYGRYLYQLVEEQNEN